MLEHLSGVLRARAVQEDQVTWDDQDGKRSEKKYQAAMMSFTSSFIVHCSRDELVASGKHEITMRLHSQSRIYFTISSCALRYSSLQA